MTWRSYDRDRADHVLLMFTAADRHAGDAQIAPASKQRGELNQLSAERADQTNSAADAAGF